jgi:hypothetical protein
LAGFFLLLSILAYFGKVFTHRFTHGNDARDPQRGDPFHPFTFGSHSQSAIQHVRQVPFEIELMAYTHGTRRKLLPPSQLRSVITLVYFPEKCYFLGQENGYNQETSHGKGNARTAAEG